MQFWPREWGGNLNEPIIKSSNSWGGLPAGILKFGIDQCITLPKAFLWAFFFLRPVTMYRVHFINLWA